MSNVRIATEQNTSLAWMLLPLVHQCSCDLFLSTSSASSLLSGTSDTLICLWINCSNVHPGLPAKQEEATIVPDPNWLHWDSLCHCMLCRIWSNLFRFCQVLFQTVGGVCAGPGSWRFTCRPRHLPQGPYHRAPPIAFIGFLAPRSVRLHATAMIFVSF